jgi:hypothetical protein
MNSNSTNLKLHLNSRDLNADHPAFPQLDEENEVATFYLWNLSGQLVGYQQYRPGASKFSKDLKKAEQKYFTWIARPYSDLKLHPKIALWGLETLSYMGPVFVIEGVFDAVKLHALGHAAIACLSNDPKQYKNFFHLLQTQRDVIPICDRDPAGKRLAKLGSRALTVPAPFKDLGDMPLCEIERFLKLHHL